MFRGAVKTLSVASSLSRAALGSRHYGKNIPTKLRISEAVSGVNVGESIKVQVTMTPPCVCRFVLAFCSLLI